MRQALIASIVVSAVAFTANCLPSATSISSSCDDVQFIFARGTGQELNEKEFLAFQGEITSLINELMPDLKRSFYELGSASQNGFRYPATDIGFISAISTTISGGSAFKFGKSVDQGINELKTYISNTSSSCPNTKFVLGGYSQGAMVITKSLASLDSEQIIYAANFGDPKLYLPEGEGIIPDACLGKNLSSYRMYVPNCRTKKGYLGPQQPYTPSAWQDKVGLWCNDKDFVCGAGLKLSEPFGTHVKYVPDGHFHSAAITIMDKMIDVLANQLIVSVSQARKTLTNTANRDVVFLLDTTSSMQSILWKKLREITRLSQAITSAGGRVALWTFGDLDEIKPQQIADFTNDFSIFQQSLTQSLPSSSGYDAPESVYSAMFTVMNTQAWRPEAVKSLVVITDNKPVSPDRDGISAKDVIRKSLEIDPVSIYTLNEDPYYDSYYIDLVDETGGEIYEDLPDDLSALGLLTRPDLNFPVSEYFGQPDDVIFYTASSSAENITQYEWDLDLDGIYETTTVKPEISVSYAAPISGFIKLRATDANGISTVASARVLISNSSPISPSLEITDINTYEQTTTINYCLSNNTIGAIISLNDIPLGISYSENLTISDIAYDTELILIPFSAEGEQGEPVTIAITGHVSDSNLSQAIATNEDPSPDNSAGLTLSDEIRKAIALVKSFREGTFIVRVPNSGQK